MAELVGTTIGKYRILAELGSGGMATVYRAEDVELGRAVALKMMHPHLARKAEYAERFRREARAVARLKHPHVLEIFDFVHVEHDGDPLTFMVAELVEGPSLGGFLRERNRMLPEVAALAAAQIASALAAAHAAGIVHRDVKPENVLVAPGGRLVLTDFGIARVLEGETVTATGALIGSPSYMSPEQARGRKPREASDVFSLGVVLYRIVTGRLPFPGKDPVTVITAILQGRYAEPMRVAPDVGTELDALIRECLEPDPARRLGSARALEERLLAFAAEGGLADPAADLAAYFVDPEGYERSARPRIAGGVVSRAREAASRGKVAEALALCDRALSLVSDHAEALALVTEITRRGRRGAALRLGLIALSAAVVAGSGVGLWLHLRDAAPRRAGGSGGVAEAPVRPDAAPGVDVAVRPAADAAVAPDAAAPGPDARVGRTGVDPRPDRRDPVVDAAAPGATPDARVGRPGPDAGASPPRAARIQVTVLPFCDLEVDGRPFGRSPMPAPQELPAGTHRIRCKHPTSGQVWERTVILKPGELLPLRGSVFPETRVTIRLGRGDRLVLGIVPHGAGVVSIAAGRYPYRLLRREELIDRGWLTIPPGACTLADSPKVECR